MSFAPISGWTSDDATAAGLSWAYDVHGQFQKVVPGFISLIAVGALRTADGFESAEQSAETVVQCASSSDYYKKFTTRTDLSSKAGDRRREARVGDPHRDPDRGRAVQPEGRRARGDRRRPRRTESLAMFVGAVPIDDVSRIRTLDTTIASLKVE